MKRLNLILAIPFVCCCFSINAQTTFQKTYGGGDSDFGYSSKQTTDGGYIITGHTTSFGDVGLSWENVLLIKTDSNGDTLWSKTYGRSLVQEGYSVQQTTDGGYIILGYTAYGVQGNDVYLIKTNDSGDVQWTKKYDRGFDDKGYSVYQTTDGGYIFTGYAQGPGSLYLIKTDSSGVILWTNIYNGPNTETGYSVQQTTDGGYIVAGETDGFGAGQKDVFLIKTDSTGVVLWTKTFGGTNSDFGRSVQQTTDGGYIITGATMSFGAGNQDIYLIKTDDIGDTLWTKTFGGLLDEVGYSVRQTADGGYIITGYTESFGAGLKDVYLIKTNGSGDTLWTKAYGGTGVDEGHSVEQTSDGGYVITGNTGIGIGQSSVYLIKTDANGIVDCSQFPTATIVGNPATQSGNTSVSGINSGIYAVPTGTLVTSAAPSDSVICLTVGIPEAGFDIENLIVYPNPSSGRFTLEMQITEAQDVVLKIISILGQEVYVEKRKLNPGIYRKEIDIRAHAKGIYLLQITTRRGVMSKRIVLEQ